MIEWEDMRFLLAVCESSSVSSAARNLQVDKATVVRHIDRLEATLGVRLIVRKASGFTPTPLGLRTALAARSMSGALTALTAELAGPRGAPRMTVSVTAPHWFCTELLMPALPELLESAPWLDLKLAATSRMLNLPQREADVALRNSKPTQGDFVARRAGVLGSALYASRAYAERHGRSRSADDWAEHRLVGYIDRLTYVPEFRRLDEAAGLAPGVTRVDDAKALAAAIKAGLGIGVVPCVLGDADPDLIRFSNDVHHESIWLVAPAELASTRGVKLVIRSVAEIFRKHAASLRG